MKNLVLLGASIILLVIAVLIINRHPEAYAAIGTMYILIFSSIITIVGIDEKKEYKK